MLLNRPVAIFDMDGTLIDSMHLWRLCYKEFLHNHNMPIPEIMLNESAEKLYTRKSIKMLLQCYPDIPMAEEEIHKEFLQIITLHYATDVKPKPGAIEFLDALRAQGVRVGLATATPKNMADVVLNRLDMTRRFDFTYYGTKEYTKSQPEYFQRIASEQGMAVDDCVMFEDAVYAMRSAKQAGMMVYAIEDRFAAADLDEIKQLADCYVHHFTELMNEGV